MGYSLATNQSYGTILLKNLSNKLLIARISIEYAQRYHN